MAPECVSSERSFGGIQKVFKAHSEHLQGSTQFGVYLPPAALSGSKCPVVYFLSGLTCTEENFIVKSGFQRYASELGLVVVNPDTSPRGAGVPGEDDSYDLGTGAGFYVDATEPKWATHYNMYSYVTKELPVLVQQSVAGGEAAAAVDVGNCGIFGHSMGGHGAITIFLKNIDKYKSCSAFAPICNPVNCAWGQKAFSAYLGPDSACWQQYDSCSLLARLPQQHLPSLSHRILIDQGSEDKFLGEQQLLGDALVATAKERGVELNYRLQPHYSHSYFFVSSFVGDHLRHHAALLNPPQQLN